MKKRIAFLLPFVVLSSFAFAGTPGHVAAQETTANKVVDFETIIGSLNTDGSLKRVRLVDDLRVFGTGDITVTDPTATSDIRNLLGFSGPDVVGNAVRYHISDLDGSAQFLTAATPDKDPPLAMAVSYALDGQKMDGGDLVGKSGDVEIAFTVRNTSARVQTVTYKDGTGKTQSVRVQVPLPLVAQLQLVLPPDHFTQVDASKADVFTDPAGNKIVNWAMVMIPPIGDLTQTFTLVAHAEDFRLGQIRLVAAPVAPKDRQFLQYAENELGGGVEKATSLYTGATEIASNMDTLHDGTLQLLDGMKKLFAGSQKLTVGLQKAFTGSGQLTSGLNEAASGSGRLTSGLQRLQEGSNLLTAGLGKAVAGVGQPSDAPTASIAGGLNALKVGLGKILGGLKQLNAGLPAAQTALAGIQAIAAAMSTLLSGAAQACAADPSGYCGKTTFAPSTTILSALQTAALCIGGGGVNDCGLQKPSIATLAGILAGPSGLGAAIDGLDQLIAGTSQAEAGAAKLLVKGIAPLRSGLQQAFEGSGKISAGLGLAHNGSQQLTSGLADRAAPGSQQLTTGLGAAHEGSGKITDGLGQAKGGAGQIESGVYAINELGVKEVARSANDTVLDIGQQLAMLRAQDRRAATESLLYGPPSSDQATTVVGGSGVVLVLDALDGRDSASATRGIYAGIALLVLLGLALLGTRAMRRTAA